MDDAKESDLIEIVQHEHDHMIKLFDDLRGTFERLVSGAVPAQERVELVETTREDLRGAFEELLHHFSQEEEIFFIEMERRFPELAAPIAELVATHEFVCDRTRWIQTVLHAGVDSISENLEPLGETISLLQTTLKAHTDRENEIFVRGLQRMTPDERGDLLRRMRELG